VTDFISTSECAERLGVSRATFDGTTKHLPGFPSAFRPSPRVVRWHWPSVQRWALARAA